MLHPAFSAFLVHRVPRPTNAVFYNSQFLVSPGAPCPPRLRTQTLKLIFHDSINSAAVSCEKLLPSGPKELFGTADTVGAAFLAVLALAHRIHGAGHLGRQQLQDVALRLSQLGFIRSRLGKAVAGPLPGKTPEEWIGHICDRASGESEATAVVNARTLLDTGIGLTIDTRNDQNGNRFCLFWTAAPSPRPMERDEISVEGLSIDDFLGACPTGVPL
jgi:hypothetical protein